MTETNTRQPSNGSEPTTPNRITRFWRRGRTPLLTASATASAWVASGVMRELGIRIVEWFW
ncbi:hypothetical protein IU479_27225 [Nocardia abscessus]|uniref:hypothetical protein n=1 Tax=Nocardia abscessus TaxID=120957 RepID=UPI0018956376|nr:hypothetical protein [Nocardia abscessus]MBF6221791.1 hypothetical protein [Nocardia abscessus]